MSYEALGSTLAESLSSPHSPSQHSVHVFFPSTYHKIIYLCMCLFPISPLDCKLHEGRDLVFLFILKFSKPNILPDPEQALKYLLNK